MSLIDSFTHVLFCVLLFIYRLNSYHNLDTYVLDYEWATTRVLSPDNKCLPYCSCQVTTHVSCQMTTRALTFHVVTWQVSCHLTTQVSCHLTTLWTHFSCHLTTHERFFPCCHLTHLLSPDNLFMLSPNDTTNSLTMTQLITVTPHSRSQYAYRHCFRWNVFCWIYFLANQ